MTSTLIVNARLVNEGREFDGDLRFSNGLIDEIGRGLSAPGRPWSMPPAVACCRG